MSGAWNVVIVDDEATLALVMRTLIQQEWPQAHVSVVTDTRDLAPKLLEVPHGATVLMDRRLGGSESYGVITSLVGARPDVRVAMLSASLGPEDAARARAAGAFAAYEKPGALGAWRQLLASVMPPAAGSPPGAGLGPSTL
ncbi:MAG: response regulator transcription factor [Dehalococcoidia bacterium]|nr:MAG: response regulator transcription factor [Dehalococcoidia bacterium]